MTTTDDAIAWMVEDLKLTTCGGRTGHGPAPVPAIPLLEPDGVVWQITTLEPR